MKAIIESSYFVRGEVITAYSSFPAYSDEIEKTLSRQLDFLNKQESDYTLTLKIVKNSS